MAEGLSRAVAPTQADEARIIRTCRFVCARCPVRSLLTTVGIPVCRQQGIEMMRNVGVPIGFDAGSPRGCENAQQSLHARIAERRHPILLQQRKGFVVTGGFWAGIDGPIRKVEVAFTQITNDVLEPGAVP